MFDVSPPDSQAPLPHRQASSSSTCTNNSRASKKGCQQIWRISRVCTSGIWREEQVRPRESNGPSLEPRGFGKPSPTYPAPSNIYCSSCPYNPLPTYNFTKWFMKDSGVFSLSVLRCFVVSFSGREHQDSSTLTVCFYQVLPGNFLGLLTLGSPLTYDLWRMTLIRMTYDLRRHSHFSYLGLV